MGYRTEIPNHTIFTQIHPHNITQLFHNLITNPIKYSPPHKPLHFHLKQNPLYNPITIRIKHNPIPIPLNKLNNIFHPFYPVHKT
uniref:ATP-binding protein n=1 Tax=Staphylococcus auricularis TaxID=29379 RepID=UPI00384D13C3